MFSHENMRKTEIAHDHTRDKISFFQNGYPPEKNVAMLAEILLQVDTTPPLVSPHPPCLVLSLAIAHCWQQDISQYTIWAS